MAALAGKDGALRHGTEAVADPAPAPAGGRRMANATANNP
jgi:hypothetical protein